MIGLAQNSTRSAIDTLCCDCAALFAGDSFADDLRRCPQCRSPRLRRHSELTQLTIAHIDCDAFFAAIEKRDNPEFADKPLIIGGGGRGVVSTACYIARVAGIHSAMPMMRARKLCPDAIIIRPNIQKYAEVGRSLRDIMLRWSPLVQPVSIDEAFLDLSGTAQLHRACPAVSLVRLAAAVHTELGITVSIGLSHNKFLAKIASDMDKPRGFAVIGKSDTQARLAPLPITNIWGVGKSFSRRLMRDGITHIHHVQAMSEAEITHRYGTIGTRLARLARGHDMRRVNPQAAPLKSISHEITFAQDISDAKLLEKHLWQLAEKTASRAKAKELAGYVVILKLKSHDFKTITRNHTLPAPTQLADMIFKTGHDMLTRYLRDYSTKKYRLIGIGIQTLVAAANADPFDLADPQKPQRIKAEHAIDDLRRKFGNDAIKKGRSL